MRGAVGLFAKSPRPGRVKTRFVPPFTHEEAAAFARICLEESLRRFPPVVAAPWTLFLDGAPEPSLTGIAGSRGVAIVDQGSGDLGDRLTRAFRRLHETERNVVMIGSDSPTLDPAWISSAFSSLESADVVLGPARDGGCYLIGARRDPGALFEGVAWGTSAVFRAIRDRAEEARASIVILPEWYDLDEAADLEHAAGDLSACPALESWLRRRGGVARPQPPASEARSP